ncbi:MAG: PEGA domain-containing protein [Myxococcales bacterium]|jgi:hypothetical protein
MHVRRPSRPLTQITTLACAALCAWLSLTRPAAARHGCPGLAPEAPPAHQVRCWARCDEPYCAREVLEWCQDAPLDHPTVGFACFRNNLRARRYAEAAELAEYLQAPTTLLRRCQEAVTEDVVVRVTTRPEGAPILVDGVEYGTSPVNLRLPSPWWTRRIAARFGTREVVAEDWHERFDTRTCNVEGLVIEDPLATAAPPEEHRRPPARIPREPPLEIERGSGRPIWPLTFGAALLTGATAVAFKVIGDGQYDALLKECGKTASCTDAQIEDSGVETSDALMGTMAIVSGALFVTSVALYAGSPSDEDRRVSLRIGPGSVRLRGSF